MSHKKNLFSITLTIVFLCLMAGCTRQAFVQKPDSMSPNVQSGEKIYADMAAYIERKPQRWDVVLFRPPPEYEGIWMFRIVGMPGEAISFSDKGLLVNGKAPEMPLSLTGVKYISAPNSQPPSSLLPFIVPADSYFVLGDNPSIANDSRMWGEISRNQILGKVLNK